MRAANTGGIVYKETDSTWTYAYWPEGVKNLVDLFEYEKKHPDWRDHAEWKLCK